jgi:phosphoglycerol transferase MdoB-like AlkP superfamily enzyme
MFSPIALNFAFQKIPKLLDSTNFFFNKKKIILAIFVFTSIFLVKNHFFEMYIVTETPFTTMAKSIAKSIKCNLIKKNENIPSFDDQIVALNAGKKKIKDSNFDSVLRKKYNVILIVLETTNYRYFLPDGPFIKNFPNLYNLSKNGIYFPNFYTPFPRSSKSFFAVLTGHYPLTNYKSIIKIAPQIEVPSLFEILKSNGYSTFAGYSGDFNYDRMSDFLKNRKVDKFVDIYDNDGEYNQISWCVDDELIYDRLINWIDSVSSDSPFFGFLLPMNSHHPFWTPKNKFKIFSENSKKNRYLNAIHYQDFLIGKLFNYLKKANKLENTIIIITGDHGIVFNSLDKKDRKESLYLMDRSYVQVPCYIYMPCVDGIKVDTGIIGSLIDIMPTILDLVGIESQKQLQGRSLFDPEINDRITFFYTDYYRHTVTGLTKNFYLMRDTTEDRTILSKNLSFIENHCEKNMEVCEMLKAKVDDFNKYQNQRLDNYY